MFRPMAAIARVIINFPTSDKNEETDELKPSTGNSQVFITAASKKKITNQGKTFTKLKPEFSTEPVSVVFFALIS